MRLKTILLAVLTVIFLNCGDDDSAGSPLENGSQIRIDEALFTNGPNDNFFLRAATITGNILNLTLDYGGGCGEVYYDLVTGDSFVLTNPVQKNIRLAFDDQDNCEALVGLELSFDLTQLQIPSTNRLIINLDGWDTPIEYNY